MHTKSKGCKPSQRHGCAGDDRTHKTPSQLTAAEEAKRTFVADYVTSSKCEISVSSRTCSRDRPRASAAESKAAFSMSEGIDDAP